MPAATMPLYIDQGATFSRTLTFRDDGGNEIDLTGRAFRGVIRRAVGAGPLIASLTFTIQDQTVPALLGQVKMSLSAAITGAIKAEAPSAPGERNVSYFLYDVEQTLPDGSIERVLEGQVIFSPRVSTL